MLIITECTSITFTAQFFSTSRLTETKTCRSRRHENKLDPTPPPPAPLSCLVIICPQVDASFSQFKPATFYISKSSLRTILYEISEIVIAGTIIRNKDISDADTIWFVCYKLPMICFFRDLFAIQNLQSLSLSTNLAVRLQGVSNVPKLASVNVIPTLP